MWACPGSPNELLIPELVYSTASELGSTRSYNMGVTPTNRTFWVDQPHAVPGVHYWGGPVI